METQLAPSTAPPSASLPALVHPHQEEAPIAHLKRLRTKSMSPDSASKRQELISSSSSSQQTASARFRVQETSSPTVCGQLACQPQVQQHGAPILTTQTPSAMPQQVSAQSHQQPSAQPVVSSAEEAAEGQWHVATVQNAQTQGPTLGMLKLNPNPNQSQPFAQPAATPADQVADIKARAVSPTDALLRNGNPRLFSNASSAPRSQIAESQPQNVSAHRIAPSIAQTQPASTQQLRTLLPGQISLTAASQTSLFPASNAERTHVIATSGSSHVDSHSFTGRGVPVSPRSTGIQISAPRVKDEKPTPSKLETVASRIPSAPRTYPASSTQQQLALNPSNTVSELEDTEEEDDDEDNDHMSVDQHSSPVYGLVPSGEPGASAAEPGDLSVPEQPSKPPASGSSIQTLIRATTPATHPTALPNGQTTAWGAILPFVIQKFQEKHPLTHYQTLLKAPAKRPLQENPNRPGKCELSYTSQINGGLIYTSGVEAEVPCKPCSNGTGMFKGCMLPPPEHMGQLPGGACADCIAFNRAAKCAYASNHQKMRKYKVNNAWQRSWETSQQWLERPITGLAAVQYERKDSFGTQAGSFLNQWDTPRYQHMETPVQRDPTQRDLVAREVVLIQDTAAGEPVRGEPAQRKSTDSLVYGSPNTAEQQKLQDMPSWAAAAYGSEPDEEGIPSQQVERRLQRKEERWGGDSEQDPLDLVSMSNPLTGTVKRANAAEGLVSLRIQQLREMDPAGRAEVRMEIAVWEAAFRVMEAEDLNVDIGGITKNRRKSGKTLHEVVSRNGCGRVRQGLHEFPPENYKNGDIDGDIMSRWVRPGLYGPARNRAGDHSNGHDYVGSRRGSEGLIMHATYP